MTYLSKKSIAALMTLVMMVCLSIVAIANDRDPRQLLTPPKITFDANEVDSEGITMVTVSFRETLIREVPFSIELTNGAIFSVDSIDDIQFVSNGVTVPMSNYSISADGTTMDVVTGQTAGPTSTIGNSFTFAVQAPIVATKFQVILRTDSTNPNLAYREITSTPVKIISGLTIEAPDVLDDVNQFDIYGTATYRKITPPAGSMVFFEVVNADLTKPQFLEFGNIEFFDQVVENGAYRYSDLILPTFQPDGIEEYEDGNYIIKIYLLGPDYNTIGYAEKEVTFKKKPNIAQISIYAPQLGRYEATKDWPEEGDIVDYRALLVHPGYDFTVPDDGHGNHNIQSKIVFKLLKEATSITNARFVAHTAYPPQSFTAIRTDKSFNASLRPLKVPPQNFVENGVSKAPYISFDYIDANGEAKSIVIGTLEPKMDPAGWVLDAETKEPIKGATVTLYKENEDGSWSMWEDPTGEQENPQISDELGKFKWDVEDGNYDVRVFHPDYVREGLEYSTLNDPNYGVISVPPEKYDIEILLPKMQILDPDPEEVDPEVEAADRKSVV